MKEYELIMGILKVLNQGNLYVTQMYSWQLVNYLSG